MKMLIKLILFVAAVLIAVGIAVFCFVMNKYNWDFEKLSTAKYETNSHTVTESFQHISVNTDTADITFLPADDSEIKVVCYEDEKASHTVTVENNTLLIKLVDNRKWYEKIGIFFGTPTISVYLPESTYTSLSVKSSTGDTEIPGDFTFNSIDISASTGDVECSAEVLDTLKIHLSTGDIEIEDTTVGTLDLSVSTGDITVASVGCEEDITVAVSTGKTWFEDVTCKKLISTGSTGDMRLKNVLAEQFSIERTTGNVKLDRCDADTITIKTDTGDVTGSLLSDKVFITETDTGRINVPKLTEGGKCEITTDTGNITFDIVK